MPKRQDYDAIEFGKRLYQKMAERGWNQSELERAAARHMRSGKFGGRRHQAASSFAP